MKPQTTTVISCFLVLALVAGCHRREYVCTITEECLNRVYPPCQNIFEQGYAPVVRPEYRWNAGATVQVEIVELTSGKVVQVATDSDPHYKTCNYRFEPVRPGHYLVVFKREGKIIDSSTFTVIASLQ